MWFEKTLYTLIAVYIEIKDLTRLGADTGSDFVLKLRAMYSFQEML